MESVESPSKEKLSDDSGKLTFRGKVILGVCGATFAGIFAVTTPFILPALRKVCLPYVPATTAQVNNVMSLVSASRGRLVDLGSGDGRIVLDAARRGFKADGVELNPWLVWYSRWSALRCGLSSSTRFYTKDLWKFDLSKYDNIVIFGVDTMMPRLEDKLLRELSAGGRVIACRFPLPTWNPVTSVGEGIDTVWCYNRTSVPNTETSTEAITEHRGETTAPRQAQNTEASTEHRGEHRTPR